MKFGMPAVWVRRSRMVMGRRTGAIDRPVSAWVATVPLPKVGNTPAKCAVPARNPRSLMPVTT